MRLENGNASSKRYFVAGIRVHMEPNEKGNASRNGMPSSLPAASTLLSA